LVVVCRKRKDRVFCVLALIITFMVVTSFVSLCFPPSALLGDNSLCAHVLNSVCLRFKRALRLHAVGADASVLANGPLLASACVTLACTVRRFCGAYVLPSLRRSSSSVDARVTRLSCVGASEDADESLRLLVSALLVPLSLSNEVFVLQKQDMRARCSGVPTSLARVSGALLDARPLFPQRACTVM
jgi:hypothetical protein